jgi:hypothetical protein
MPFDLYQACGDSTYCFWTVDLLRGAPPLPYTVPTLPLPLWPTYRTIEVSNPQQSFIAAINSALFAGSAIFRFQGPGQFDTIWGFALTPVFENVVQVPIIRQFDTPVQIFQQPARLSWSLRVSRSPRGS